MKRDAWLLALVLLAGFAGLAGAQGNSVVVCAKELSDPGSLSWSSYLDTAQDPARRIDHDALAAMVNARSGAWPPSVSGPIRAALLSFRNRDDSLKGKALRISKTPDLISPQQFGFPDTIHRIELPLDAAAPLCSNPVEAAARIDAAYVILLLERVHAEVLARPMRDASDAISELEAKYDRYLYEGFPMFPWEAWANSKFLTESTIADGPPRNSLVLLHPAAGVVGSLKSSARSDTDGTLAVEALGWIRYRDDYKSWYGASLLAVFPTDRDPGYGIALNYNLYKLGLTWHDDKATDHDGLTLFLGMDFLQFVNEKYRSYESYKRKVDALTEAAH